MDADFAYTAYTVDLRKVSVADIKELRPGRDADVLVGRHVLGFVLHEHRHTWLVAANDLSAASWLTTQGNPFAGADFWGDGLPHFSERITPAFVLERALAEQSREPLWEIYGVTLMEVVGREAGGGMDTNLARGATVEGISIKWWEAHPWNLCHAAPLQRCQAALILAKRFMESRRVPLYVFR